MQKEKFTFIIRRISKSFLHAGFISAILGIFSINIAPSEIIFKTMFFFFISYFILSFIFWRCPSCKKRFPLAIISPYDNITACPFCKSQLRPDYAVDVYKAVSKKQEIYFTAVIIILFIIFGKIYNNYEIKMLSTFDSSKLTKASIYDSNYAKDLDCKIDNTVLQQISGNIINSKKVDKGHSVVQLSNQRKINLMLIFNESDGLKTVLIECIDDNSVYVIIDKVGYEGKFLLVHSQWLSSYLKQTASTFE